MSNLDVLGDIQKKDIFTNLWNSIKQVFNAIGRFFQNIFNNYSGGVNGPLAVFITIFTLFMLDGIFWTLRAMFIGKGLEVLAEKSSKALKSKFIQNILDFFEKLEYKISGINNKIKILLYYAVENSMNEILDKNIKEKDGFFSIEEYGFYLIQDITNDIFEKFKFEDQIKDKNTLITKFFNNIKMDLKVLEDEKDSDIIVINKNNGESIIKSSDQDQIKNLIINKKNINLFKSHIYNTILLSKNNKEENIKIEILNDIKALSKNKFESKEIK